MALVVVAGVCADAPAQNCHPYWTHLPLPPGGFAYGLPIFDDGTGPALYSQGIVPPSPHWRVMKWTGTGWIPLNYESPSGDMLTGMVLDDGTGSKLYGGRRVEPNVEYFRWDGAEWEPLPAAFGASPNVYDMISFDDGAGRRVFGFRDLWVPPVEPHVVRWDGTSWTVIGTAGLTGGHNLWDMAVHDDGSGPAMYVVGDFTSMNGVAAQHIARWNGLTWAPVGAGLSRLAIRLAVLDLGTGPKLYTLGGELGPNNEYLVCVWDGHTWSNIGGASAPGGTVFDITSMVPYDDGTGPGLAVGGNFPYMGGVEVRGAARWNGQAWSAMGAGIHYPSGGLSFDEFAACPDVRGPSLFALGAHFGYGGGTTGDIAQWVGCPNCYANCDLSTVPPKLNVRDFICFINKFTEGDPYANCTVNDPSIDIADFVCFLNKFAAGCP